MNNYFKAVLMVIMMSLVTSHYSERYFIDPLILLKNLVLFKNVDRFDTTDKQLYTKYTFLDEPVINPVHVAQQAFKGAEKYLFTRYFPDSKEFLYDPEVAVDEKKILEIADKFIANYSPEVISGLTVVRLPYNFDYPSYDLKKPWYSGMAQGLAVVVLLAAYEISKDDKYFKMSLKVGLALRIPVTQGGTLLNLGEQNLWHEEYADASKKVHPKVLNGNNFAIDGIFWLKKFTNESLWNDILKNSIKGLNNNIHLYDGFCWSKYGLSGNYANWKYHNLHILQLNKIAHVYSLESIADTDLIEEYSSRFRQYINIPLGFTVRLLFQSNNMLFAVLLINLVLNYFFIFFLSLLSRRVKNWKRYEFN
ncbi:D-glucuronyl C5-epimerase family protein [Pseudomonadales bacterium]|nr:D-glucuronyl C5-epimerase family protein [Pseudomonadales bacterium]